MNIWLVIIIGGLITYAIRLSFIVVFGKMQIPPLVSRALRFIPPAVLTAIIFPEVLMPSGKPEITFTNARLLAAVLAGLVAWRTRNAVLTILAGMIALLVLQAIL
jgi:branched-subunit amino acid transport protein